GMGEQEVLYLLGIDVLAAAAEHVVDAAAEIEEPILVLAEDVAGVQPSIRELGAGDFRLVVIAEADIGASDEQFSLLGVAALRVDQPELDVRGGHTRTAARDRTAVDPRARRAAAFGQSVTFRHLDVRKRALDRIEKLWGHHRRSDG